MGDGVVCCVGFGYVVGMVVCKDYGVGIVF